MIMSPEAENFSWAISISTTVSCPKASWDTQAKKWRTMNSYTRPSLPWEEHKETTSSVYCNYLLKMWLFSVYKTETIEIKKKIPVNDTCSALVNLVGCMGGWAWSEFLPCLGLGPPGWSSTRWANAPHTGLWVCCSTSGVRAKFGGKMLVSVRG